MGHELWGHWSVYKAVAISIQTINTTRILSLIIMILSFLLEQQTPCHGNRGGNHRSVPMTGQNVTNVDLLWNEILPSVAQIGVVIFTENGPWKRISDENCPFLSQIKRKVNFLSDNLRESIFSNKQHGDYVYSCKQTVIGSLVA